MTDWFKGYIWKLPSDVKPADYVFWCKAKNWKLHEGVSLALGADPDSAKKFVKMGFRSFTPGLNKKPSFEVAYEMLLKLAKRNFPDRAPSRAVKKGDFVQWLIAESLPIPNALKTQMGELEFAQNDLDPTSITPKDHTNLALQSKSALKTAEFKVATLERISMLKLIIGMAVGFYGYDPKKNRNPTASQIKSDLALKGVKIDANTIRKYLDEAKTLWPFE
jgi:hypothetical protein